jgi:peptidoglycan/LPS O-acetylase OafA/YrhL
MRNLESTAHWASIFSIGIVCYLIYKSYLPMIKSEYRVSASLYMLSLFILILFGLIQNPEFPDLPWPLGVGLIIYGVAFSLLIFSLSLFPNQLIVNRITRFYGMISFSFYLVHPFFVEFLKPVYNYIYTHIILSTDLSFCLCLLLTLLIVTPISLLTYHLIETPGMRYGKRIIAKL